MLNLWLWCSKYYYDIKCDVKSCWIVLQWGGHGHVSARAVIHHYWPNELAVDSFEFDATQRTFWDCNWNLQFARQGGRRVGRWNPELHGREENNAGHSPISTEYQRRQEPVVLELQSFLLGRYRRRGAKSAGLTLPHAARNSAHKRTSVLDRLYTAGVLHVSYICTSNCNRNCN